ncbi:MAG: LysO family transporter [Bacteroidaceae bacterium]|nr:LysO family transporter [Bacteroidaceae bacterium]
MFVVIAMMFSGIAFGYLMRRHRFTHIGKIIIFFIWTLLFVLGIEVGGNPNVMNSLHTLGIEALFIAGMSILGSAVAAMLLWKHVKKEEERRNGNER